MSAVTLVGMDVTLESREGEPLTSTLLRTGYMMRLACKRGGCGLCRVHVDSGVTEYNSTVAETVLPSWEREQGIILACRSVPVSDVTISVPEEGRLRCIAPLITQYVLREQDRVRHRGTPMGDTATE